MLLRHYKLASIRICACLKCLNRSEYVLAEAPNFGLFVTRDGAFWSPLPVLSKDDLLTLQESGFGAYSTRPFIGDAGIVLTKVLTELHRVAQFALLMQTLALYPKDSLAYAERWQGMDGNTAADINNFEFHEGAGAFLLELYPDLKQDKGYFKL